jgi:hypothetical protein
MTSTGKKLVMPSGDNISIRSLLRPHDAFGNQ